MSGNEDLAPRDRALVEQIAEATAPPPWSPERRAAFDAAVAERIAAAEAGGRTRWIWAPALAGAAAAAALAGVWWLGAAPSDEPAAAGFEIALRTAPAADDEAGADADSWEADLVTADPLADAPDRDVSLPDDYIAIADAFLGG